MLDFELWLTKMLAFIPWLPAIVKGLSSALVVVFVGKVLASLYRTHGYLYQFADRSMALENWIHLFLPIAERIRLKNYRESLKLSISRAGLRRDLTVDYFLATQIFYGVATFVCLYLLLNVVLGVSLVFILLLSMITAALPALNVHEQARGRIRSIRRDLSFFLDYLALAISAGMDFTRALESLVQNAPKTPLRDEFTIIQRDLQLGVTKEKALLSLEERVQSLEVKTFVQNLVQALKLGTNLTETLQTLSSSINSKRFQMAEEEAGKISVKMMLPLIMFILPCIFILLIGPMLLSFINAGF